MSRWRAFTIHLVISALIALVFLMICRFFWFDGPLFGVTGGAGLLSILVPVDVIIGPILTLLIFKAGKPTLKMDLSLIALVQFAALVYGALIMIQARPLYAVLYHEELRVIRPLDLSDMPWQKAVLAPIQYVRVSSEMGALADIEEQMAAYTQITPPHLDPKNYQNLGGYQAEFKAALRSMLPPSLKAFESRYKELLNQLPEAPEGYGVLPVVARGERHVGVFDRASLKLVAVISTKSG